MLTFSNCLSNLKYYDKSNKLVIGKTKNETRGIAIQELFGLKREMYLLLVDNTQHKKTKGMNRNFAATTSHNEYKVVLLNDKCLRHAMNRIQNKDHTIET